MTRRIVDLKDVNTQELVYPATHSDAVLMPDGKTVTEAIANAGGGGNESDVDGYVCQSFTIRDIWHVIEGNVITISAEDAQHIAYPASNKRAYVRNEFGMVGGYVAVWDASEDRAMILCGNSIYCILLYFNIDDTFSITKAEHYRLGEFATQKYVQDAIANVSKSVHIDVDSSGEYALTKDAANYANFNIADALCTFTFANAPTHENIIGGSWGEYKLYLFYSQNATISFNAGIVWGENCGAPIFEMGYIYEFSFVPIAFDNKVTWLGLWSKTAEKNIITIEFAYDSDLQCYTLTASESVSSDITFAFENGMRIEMAAGESYAETIEGVEEGWGMPAMMLGELSDYTVYDDYNIYKLVDKT